VQVDLRIDRILSPAQFQEHAFRHVRASKADLLAGAEQGCGIGWHRQAFLQHGLLIGTAKACLGGWLRRLDESLRLA
jgi:hypothetical protein